jgi:hypothetical protein
MGAIPVWMTDAAACSKFSTGDPQVSVEALVALRALLDSLRSSRSAGDGAAGGDEESREALDFTATKGEQGSSSTDQIVGGKSRTQRAG